MKFLNDTSLNYLIQKITHPQKINLYYNGPIPDDDDNANVENVFSIRPSGIYLGNRKNDVDEKTNYLRMSHSHTYLNGGSILSLRATSNNNSYGSVIIGANNYSNGFIPGNSYSSNYTNAVQNILLTTYNSDIDMHDSTIRMRASENIYLCAGLNKGSSDDNANASGYHISLVGGKIRILSTAKQWDNGVGYDNSGFIVSIEESKLNSCIGDDWDTRPSDYKVQGNRLEINTQKTNIYNKSIIMGCDKDIYIGEHIPSLYFENDFTNSPTGSLIYLSEEKVGIRSKNSRILLRNKQIRINSEKFVTYDCLNNPIFHINTTRNALTFGKFLYETPPYNSTQYQGHFAYEDGISLLGGIAYGHNNIIMGNQSSHTLTLIATGGNSDVVIVENVSEDYVSYNLTFTNALTTLFDIHGNSDFFIVLMNNDGSHLLRVHFDKNDNTHKTLITQLLSNIFARPRNSILSAFNSNSVNKIYAITDFSHAAFGYNSVVMGYSNLSQHNNQLMIGKYGAPEDKAFIIGGGLALNNRVNIMSVDWNGNVNANDYLINNISIQDTFATKDDTQSSQTVEGNIVHIEDAAPINAEGCKVILIPKQEGTGDPNPTNVRPITGYTGVELTQTGKNLLPLTVENLKAINTSGTWNGNIYTLNDVDFTINLDDDNNLTGITVNGTASDATAFILTHGQYNNMPIKNGTYKLNGCPVGGGASSYKLTIDNRTDSGTTISYGTDFGDGTQIEITQGLSRVFLTVYGNYTANNLVFYPMLRPATDTDSTYEPYQSNTFPVTFPAAAGTVYGCEVDYLRGKLRVTEVSEIYDGSNDENWSNRTGTDGNANLFEIQIPDVKNIPQSTSQVGKCNLFPWLLTVATDKTYRLMWRILTVHYDGITLSEWKNMLAETPLQITYPLATPIEYDLTPQQIALFENYNNLWADNGIVNLTYQPNNMVGELKGQIQDLQEQINILITQLNNLS